jgi:hypothetical protein
MGAMAGLEIRAKNLDEEIAQNPTRADPVIDESIVK